MKLQYGLLFVAVPPQRLLVTQLVIISAQYLCIIEDFHHFLSPLIMDSVYGMERKENNRERGVRV